MKLYNSYPFYSIFFLYFLFKNQPNQLVTEDRRQLKNILVKSEKITDIFLKEINHPSTTINT